MAAPAVDFAALSQKYAVEKDKRLRPDGLTQYIEIDVSDKWAEISHDPWVDHAALNAAPVTLKDGDTVKVLILGAGFGGLVYGARLVQAGFKAADIRLVDTAGGFGGTWYWNRYPGLMCDIEGYVYMPLLEETGYIPKHKYSYGPELREYAELAAKKFGLQGVFRTAAKASVWDEVAKQWVTTLEQDRGPEGTVTLTVRSQFVINANGVLNHPKAPKCLGNYNGDVFHTARWNYGLTGGSPNDPSLTGLEGKRVGFVGTGATGVQVIPHLAKWAKELYVFQRTPSSVSARDQRPTDPEEWKTKIATGPGWHRKRNENMNDFMSNAGQGENLVNDNWTKAKAYGALIGAPHDNPLGMGDLRAHIGKFIALDYEHSEGARQRVDAIVKDKATAESLKAWYPIWCKRPTFHDDYLPTFNLPNVHLVDTDGKGVTGSTANALLVGDKEYPIDILILGTGYRPPAQGGGESGAVSNMLITGRGGKTMKEKWEVTGPATLHGVLTHDFPNFFLTGPAQAGTAANYTHVQDLLSEQVAYIAATAIAKAGDAAVVEVTHEAEEAWTMQILTRALWMAPIGICTPSYVTNEGQMGEGPAEQMKIMRGAPYQQGINAYSQVLKEWRAKGDMEGLVVTS